jgi:predicted ester cyclase
MSDENKAVVGRWVDELWNKGNMAIVDELGEPDVLMSYPLTGELRGRKEVKDGVTRLRTALPDVAFSIAGEVIAEGEYVAARWKGQATQTGALGAIAATGKPVTWMGMSIFRVVGGKVVEEIGEEDALSMLEQIDAIPHQRLR